ncbi:class I adenylate-forming enzyme family protein [Hoyosella altamirensis]|uniref:Acyl-CoA synthetase (AMP-forming)/AMP-acid ligase II n=1 Tax=Hoyosella altamirensis TaxID=616997 RepID=A0A839RP01_9ACTN|nr:AMP-binding protein [Hoyosella altamirensis]MBB3038240.1 acyl-CoA synthetase (AMP-forming)/AMP-acid ligase II [Hoyosella altamirensis]
MNLTEVPELRAEQSPTGSAVSDDHTDLDNAAFLDTVNRHAATLDSHGVSAGDVVAVMLPNTTALVTTLFAAWRLGAAVTPINPALAPAEVAYQVTDAAAKVLVTDDEIISPATVVTTTDLANGAAHGGSRPVTYSENALALVIYTSGTTGRPKGVMLDHKNLNAMCSMVIEALELTVADRSLLILPLFHVNGIVVSTLSPLLSGGSTVVAGTFSPKTFFNLVERVRPTYFSAVPTIYTILSNLPDEVQPDTSSIRFGICGAAPASVELIEKFQGRYGVPIIEGYGLSEGTCASTINPLHGVRKPGTVGKPFPGQQVRIVDADGTPVEDGKVGEVFITGPNIMRGYLNRPEETAKTIVDGWLRTGDIGRLDEDGYLVLVDRAKDMIIRGGENIYPKEIEAVTYQMPGIAEVAVVGRPTDVYGEEPVLFASLTPQSDLTVDDILAHLRTNLAKYKVPVEVTILDGLPKNPVGKLDKPTLRRSLADA